MEVQRLIAEGQVYITKPALDGAFALGFDSQDISECISDFLEETHFFKTMPATKKAGLMQDVYRITYENKPIYLKVQIFNKQAVVVSFKAE